MDLSKLKEYYNDERFSDLRIECGDLVIKAHRVIVCSQSEFLSKACEGAFEESYTRKIRFSDEDPVLVETMLRFMYEGEYSIPNMEESVIEPAFHAAMMGTADKYAVPRLFDFANKSYKKLLHSRSKYSLRAMLGCASAMYKILPETDESIRGPLAAVVTHEYAVLQDRGEWMDEAAKAEMSLSWAIQAHPDLAVGVMANIFEYLRRPMKECYLSHSYDIKLERWNDNPVHFCDDCNGGFCVSHSLAGYSSHFEEDALICARCIQRKAETEWEEKPLKDGKQKAHKEHTEEKSKAFYIQ